jgi:hypothetical protein
MDDERDAAYDERIDVRCIARAHTAHAGEAWCGRTISCEWHFVSIDHAAEHGLRDGTVPICGGCVAAVNEALNKATP